MVVFCLFWCAAPFAILVNPVHCILEKNQLISPSFHYQTRIDKFAPCIQVLCHSRQIFQPNQFLHTSMIVE